MNEFINVVKVGGAVVENQESRGAFLKVFAAMPGRKVLVHGGGRTATSVASRLGIETRMAEGRRITDKAMLEVVTMVYAGLMNKTVVAELQAIGINAIGLTGADMACIMAHKRPAGEIDYGFVGDVDSVNAQALVRLMNMDCGGPDCGASPEIAGGVVPVVAPLSYSIEDGLLNTNADTIATEVAKSLSGLCPVGESSGLVNVTLTFCFEKPGVLSDPDDDGSVVNKIDTESYMSLRAEGVISGGMIPKMDNAFAALRAGVSKVVITNAACLGLETGTVVTL